MNSYVSLLRAMKKFRQIASANIMMALLRFLLAVVLVMLGLGAVGGVAGLLFSIMVVSVYLAYHATGINLPRSKGFAKDMISETFYVSIIVLSYCDILKRISSHSRFRCEYWVSTSLMERNQRLILKLMFLLDVP
jgi:hypothetical protein